MGIRSTAVNFDVIPTRKTLIETFLSSAYSRKVFSFLIHETQSLLHCSDLLFVTEDRRNTGTIHANKQIKARKQQRAYSRGQSKLANNGIGGIAESFLHRSSI